MIKKSLTVLALVALVATTVNAQWTNEGAFPDTSWTGSTHGIAVDPDGKVWVSSYYHEIPWDTGTDTVMTSGMYVYNPDGTEADFSPVTHFELDGGFTVDTLVGNNRGMDTDQDGNILYVQSGPSKIYKIDYLTGDYIASAEIGEELGTSPTRAVASDDGTIFIGPVVGNMGNPIIMLDSDLNFIGNAVDLVPDISRTMEVSADGNTIYWPAFTGKMETTIYQRADEFSAYDSVGVLFAGMSVETISLHPVTGNLWVSNDSRDVTNGSLDSLTWGEWDFDAEAFVDSFKFEAKAPGVDDMFPRGFAFSPDGNTAYIGTYSAVQDRIQKVVTGPVSVDPNNMVSTVPHEYELAQNYPNPFNPSTVISFSIPENAFVTLKVYNMLGQEVAVLVNEITNAGSHKVNFLANNLATGMYVYMIQAGDFSASKKMMLVK